MKITGVETIVLKKPVEHPVSDSLHTYDVGGHLLTKVRTDEGVTGTALTYFGRIHSGMETVKLIIDRELSEVIRGQDPHMVRKIRNDMYVATEYYGTVGVANFAIAAIDNALWDIMGKAAGLPTAMVLGARREAIPAYAMVGWYYGGGMKEFIKQCEDAASEGFGAVKLKVGRDSLAEDQERIRAIHKALGEEFRVMVDANCIFDEAEALRRGHAYEELGVYWFEEPLQPYMRDSHVRLRDKLRIPIAVGENYYTRHQFYDVIRSGGASIVQPDNRRAGGVTEWMDIAAVSEAAGCKLASHGGGPGNVNVLCAIENAIYMESGSLAKENEMFVTPLRMEKGCILIPDVPGMGTDVDETYMKLYRMDR
ncbi:MAG: mandelate racemase/muconate lactonizing enzyme family protein [Lachnospiraceae bacterium]|nr:mandelate racemase/muconate lactonizing enzyme family protein [Lachnospiraceae bacterium]